MGDQWSVPIPQCCIGYCVSGRYANTVHIIRRMRKENDMGVYIPNMSKPKSCGECDLWSNCFYPKNPYTEQDDCIAPDCPLIEIDDEAIDIAQDIMDGCKELKERVDKGIVRCEECKWSYTDERDGLKWCKVHMSHYRVNADHFCSYGERRNDEDTEQRLKD